MLRRWLMVLLGCCGTLVATSAFAGTFLDSLNADPRKVDSSPYATGGDIILNEGGDYIHIFYDTSAAAAFTPSQDLNVRVLVIGGGGSGAGKTQTTGGGGAGGFVERMGVALSSGTAYAVTVGKGGATATGNGGNSGSNSQFDTILAYGGGGGGGFSENPKSGGSGGGGYHTNGGNATGAQPTDSSQGNAGADGIKDVGGGGGGGAGAPGDIPREQAGTTAYGGKHGGLGGDGRPSDILGFERYFAGGGSGGAGGNDKGGDPKDGFIRAPGGKGGGGSGARFCTTDEINGVVYGKSGEPGEDGLGGGGGGISRAGGSGGAGGSGIVIVRYFVWTEPTPLLRAPTVELVGGTRVAAKGEVASHGVGASSTTLHLTLTPTTGEAKTKECVVSETADENGVPFEFYLGNLQPDAQYGYELYGENDKGERTAVVTGTLTTMAASLDATATGATITTVGYDKVVNFSTPGSYTLHIGGDGYAQILVVGGGGAGGYGGDSCSGGGAGGVLYSEKVYLVPGDYPVVVGAGGVNKTGSVVEQQNNGHGKDSSFNAGAEGAIVATGGGSGIGWDCESTGADGGSGGGGCRQTRKPGSGIFGQGFAGGKSSSGFYAAGGGGAGGPGQDAASNMAGNGGPGLVFSITGESVCYGAGGGGGCKGSEHGGVGGSANAGCGADGADKTAATSGMDGTGSGGGGAGKGYATPGAGGCGCVIIRYTDYSLLPEGTAPVIAVEPVANAKAASFDLPVSMASMGEADRITLTLALWDNAEDAESQADATKQVKTLVENWDGSRRVFTIDGLTSLATYYFRLVADGGSPELTTVGDVMTVVLTELVWTTGQYNPDTWQPHPNNQLFRHCPLTDGSAGTVSSIPRLNDGSVSFVENYTGCANDFVWTWSFNTPIDMTALRIFSRWKDDGRDGIHISDVQVRYEGAGSYVSVGCGACDYDENKLTQFAYLTRSDNAAFAQKVVAIKVMGGAQDHDGTGYAEVEVIGTESYDDIPLWNYTTYTYDGWVAAEGNVLGSATLTSSENLGSGATSELNNGKVTVDKGTGGTEIKTGGNLCWQLAEPTDIGELRFYSYWGDAGRDGIAVDDILVKTSHEGEWMSISTCYPKFDPKFSVGVKITTAPLNTGRIFVSLKRPDGAALYPEAVTDVQIVFGTQDNGYTRYDEIEVLKWTNPIKLGEVSASVDLTTVNWSGAMSKVGSDETVLTLYVSTDGVNFTAEKAWTVTDTAVQTYSKDFDQDYLTVYWYFEAVTEDNKGKSWSVRSPTESVQTQSKTVPIIAFETKEVGAAFVKGRVTLVRVGDGSESADVYAAWCDEGGTLSTPVKIAEGVKAGETVDYTFVGLTPQGAATLSVYAVNDGDKTSEIIQRTEKLAALGTPWLELTVAGYTGSETLTDFPVLVRLPANFAYYADCGEGGATIRFADADGNLLSHEIDTWNPSGESLIWVKLPSLAPSGTKFTMLFGDKNPLAGETVDPTKTWSRYAAVIHGGTANGLKDAAGKLTVTAGSNAVSASDTSGRIGGGIAKTTANAIGVNVEAPGSGKAKVLTADTCFSVSAWFYRDAAGTQIFGSSRSGWGNANGWMWNQEGTQRISISHMGAHEFSDSGLPQFAAQTWGHAAFAYEGGKVLTAFLNGACYKTVNNPGQLHPTTGGGYNNCWTFGSYQNAGSSDSLKGAMDEIRIFNGYASADWFKAEYETSTKANFLAYGEISVVDLGAEPMVELVSLVKPDETKPKGLATVNVTWAGEGCATVTAEIQYREKGTENAWQSAKSFENVIGLSALDFKLPGGKTYEVKVIAKNANDKSAESEPLEIEMPQGKSGTVIMFLMKE